MPKVKKTNKKKSSNVVPLKRDLVQSENTENLSLIKFAY